MKTLVVCGGRAPYDANSMEGRSGVELRRSFTDENSSRC
jgi:hypothetical protein